MDKNSPEFKRLVDRETLIVCKEVAHMTQDQVVESLRGFEGVLLENKFPHKSGITELRILLSSLIAMARVEERLGETIW